MITNGETTTQAEEYHFRLDQEDAQNTEATQWPYCVNTVGSGASVDDVSSAGLFGILYTRPITQSDRGHMTRTKPFIAALPPDGMFKRN